MEKILSDLKAMRLPGMAQTWQNLMEAHKIDSISMADGIRMLIQGENDMRMSNRTHRLIKNAHFRYTVALGEIAADSARGIDQSLLNAADAILDRVVNTASRFALKGDSLRIKQ